MASKKEILENWLKRPNLWEKITKENKQQLVNYAKERTAQNLDINTIKGEINSLRKICKYFYPKNIKKLTKQELQNFFTNEKEYGKISCRDRYATHLTNFDQWAFDLERRERHKRMKWYRYQSKTQKKKSMTEEEKKKQFITIEEYEKLIFSPISIQSKAMWEMYYLTGFRCGEPIGKENDPENDPSKNYNKYCMRIKDFKEIQTGYEMTVRDSKTIPRTVALCKTPTNILRWLENHPDKNNPNAPLWLSESNQNYGKPIVRNGAISQKLKVNLRKAGFNEKRIKELSPQNFRATRASIMFGKRTKDNGIIFDDKQIADFFGWDVSQVPARRIQYDLSSYEELRKIIHAEITKEKDKETLLIENKKLSENQEKTIAELKEELETVKSTLEHARNYARTTEDDRLKIKEEFEEIKKIKKEIFEKLNIIKGEEKIIRIEEEGKPEELEVETISQYDENDKLSFLRNPRLMKINGKYMPFKVRIGKIAEKEREEWAEEKKKIKPIVTKEERENYEEMYRHYEYYLDYLKGEDTIKDFKNYLKKIGQLEKYPFLKKWKD